MLWPRAERMQGRVLRPPGQVRPQADAALPAGEAVPAAERGAGEISDAGAGEPEAGPGPAAAGEPGAAGDRRSADSPAGALPDAPNGIAHEAAAAPSGLEDALDPGGAEAPSAAGEQAPAAAGEAASAPAAEAARSAAGTLAYLDASGKERRASFALEQAAQPDGGPGGDAGAAPALAPGDDVEFSVVVDRRTGNVRAEDVRLIRRAQSPACPALRRAPVPLQVKHVAQTQEGSLCACTACLMHTCVLGKSQACDLYTDDYMCV